MSPELVVITKMCARLVATDFVLVLVLSKEQEILSTKGSEVRTCRELPMTVPEDTARDFAMMKTRWWCQWLM